MFRFVVTLCFLSLLFCSVSCQMCDSPHDYRLTGFVDRQYDYRGFYSDYRAGSLFSDDRYDVSYQTADNLYSNAGNFGTTTSVTIERRDPDPGMFGISPDDTDAFGIPDRPSVPSVPDYLRTPARPDTSPTAPSAIPGVAPLLFEGTPGETTTPFSPSDEIVAPPSTVPTILDTELPITLEELRRLDPSVQDIQIISIEDAALETQVK